MSKSQSSILAAVTLTVLALGVPNVFAEEPAKPNDLNDYLCRDLMRLSGEDREIALALVHGYRLGKKGTTQFETQALAEITDKFIDYCLDHPRENALQSFDKVAK
jgi:hypothetical protein